MKLLADMAEKQNMMNREYQAAGDGAAGATDLIVTIAILGGCLIGVLIAVCACYCVKCKKDFDKTQHFGGVSLQTLCALTSLLVR